MTTIEAPDSEGRTVTLKSSKPIPELYEVRTDGVIEFVGYRSQAIAHWQRRTNA